jgi:hypothetical protein
MNKLIALRNADGGLVGSCLSWFLAPVPIHRSLQAA